MSAERLRLLILTPEFTGFGGGIITFYRTLAAELVRRGVDVRVVQGSGFFSGERSPTKIDGVEIETLESSRVDRWLAKFGALNGAPTFKRSLAGAWAAWEQALEGPGFDVVEATDFGHLAAPVILANTHPCVLQMHGSQGQIGRHDPIEGHELGNILSLALETELCATAHAVQCSSKANARYWTFQSGRNDISIIPPAWRTITEEQPSPVSDRLAVVGRVQRWKGPHILCEALRSLGSEAPHVDWHGRDTSFETDGRMTTQWLADSFPDVWNLRLHHRGQVPPDQVRHIQQTAMFNLIPSTWDVFNFTVIEAMSSGRPVICSSGAGASEMIEDGVSGFVYDGDDPAALAKTLRRALALSEAERVGLAAQARKRLDDVLDPESVTRARMDAYEAARMWRPRPPARKDWMSDLCAVTPETGDNLRFLDNLPLRSIVTYAGRRSFGKVTGR